MTLETGRPQRLRAATLSLGIEADHAEIQAWAHEMRAWMNLTAGDYHGVVAEARHGTDVAPHHAVSVQLAAQEARAAGQGLETAAKRKLHSTGVERLLDTLPYPDNLDNHFVVDPTKFDFYAMDCYRMLAEDGMAETSPTRLSAH